MKSHILLALLLVGIVFTSCKKQYSCQCSTTVTKTGYYPYTVSSIEKIDSKTTKKTAEKICTQSEKQIASNDEDYKSSGQKITVSCALKY